MFKNGYTLVHEATGAPVQIDVDKVVTQDGIFHITGGYPPAHAGSIGRIYLKKVGSNETREFFPGVGKCKWIRSEKPASQKPISLESRSMLLKLETMQRHVGEHIDEFNLLRSTQQIPAQHCDAIKRALLQANEKLYEAGALIIEADKHRASSTRTYVTIKDGGK